MRRVLIGRHDIAGEAEPFGNPFGQALGLGGAGLARAGGLGRDQAGVAPDRLAVAPPVQAEGPARQAFARIPFALAVMQQAARAEADLQPPDQVRDTSIANSNSTSAGSTTPLIGAAER
jgi:hypothetical protein